MTLVSRLTYTRVSPIYLPQTSSHSTTSNQTSTNMEEPTTLSLLLASSSRYTHPTNSLVAIFQPSLSHSRLMKEVKNNSPNMVRYHSRCCQNWPEGPNACPNLAKRFASFFPPYCPVELDSKLYRTVDYHKARKRGSLMQFPMFLRKLQ